MTLAVLTKYHDSEMPRLKKIKKGDWIDLCSIEDIYLTAGKFEKISLGISMEIPEEYEAYLLPRGSTFEKYGIIQTNSMGIIDNTFSGNNDIWQMPVYPTRDIFIPKYTRIAQFRIMDRMPEIALIEVAEMHNPDRSSFGSTGEQQFMDIGEE